MRILETFHMLPIAALVNEKIFCCHGGLSPEFNQLPSLDILRSIPRPVALNDGLLWDLVWSDPSMEIDDWTPNEERNTSYYFSERNLLEFLDRFNLSMVIRGHQQCDQGFEFIWNKKFLTVFTAPRYQNEENIGAMVRLHRNEKHRILVCFLLCCLVFIGFYMFPSYMA